MSIDSSTKKGNERSVKSMVKLKFELVAGHNKKLHMLAASHNEMLTWS
jgi:hypothetical protein